MQHEFVLHKERYENELLCLKLLFYNMIFLMVSLFLTLVATIHLL